MIYKRAQYCCFSILTILMLEANAPAYAFSPALTDDSADLFAHETPLEREALDDLRGGFITSNGMMIDFTFSANTLVDGQLVNQVLLQTADLVANASALKNIIQIGQGNMAFDDEVDLARLPNVLTVLQNNMDNLTIQQLNLLDLTVQNMSNFTRAAIMPEIDFQNSFGLAP